MVRDMDLRDRVMACAGRLRVESVAALARLLETEPQYLFKAFAGDGKAHASMVKLADKTGVSVHWLETGDPAEAPPWADRKQVALDAARALSERDRVWMLRALTRGDLDDDPDGVTAELVQLRDDRATMERHLRKIHHTLANQCTELQAMLDVVMKAARDLGVGLDSPPQNENLQNIQADADLAAIKETMPRAAAKGTIYHNKQPDPTRGAADVAP